MQKVWAKRNGFTIVELLIVIAIIGILAAISIVTYNGVQTRAKMEKIKTDLTAVQKLVQSYKARNGTYPITAAELNIDWVVATANTDSNCSIGARVSEWIPDLSASLPQSSLVKGIGSLAGCYIYASDGTSYVISAWNMLKDPQTTTMYRRVGFREMDPSYNQFSLCNYPAIGGVNGSYNINNDYYKHSMTLTNITSATCNETPPAGA